MKTGMLIFAVFAGAALTAAESVVTAVAAPAAVKAAPAAPVAAKPAPAAAPVAAKPAPAAAPAAVKAAPAAPVAAKAAPAAPVAAKPAPAAVPTKEEEPGFALCIARGLCNICTGWLELPRCAIYDNGFIPVFGLIVGIPEGAFFTVGRTFSGVFDLVSFGSSGNIFHGKNFPDTVFQAKWNYKK